MLQVKQALHFCFNLARLLLLLLVATSAVFLDDELAAGDDLDDVGLQTVEVGALFDDTVAANADGSPNLVLIDTWPLFLVGRLG